MAQTANASWLALPRSSAVGWAPLTQNPFEPAFHPDEPNKTEMFSEVDRHLIINVSGRHYEISEYLVNRYPFTLLGCEDRNKYYRKETNEFFFDRDPEFFRYVLLFYRQGFTHFPRNECSSSFEDEMAFFRIDMEDLNPCCYEVYEDFHQETLERLADIENEAQPKRNTKFDKIPLGRIRGKVHDAFENPTSSLLAQVIYYVSGFFIAISVLANIMETIPVAFVSGNPTQWTNLGLVYEPIFGCLDATCVIIFTCEYIFRLFGSPEPWKFLRSIMSIIDVVAILPFYIGLMVPDNKEVSGAFTTLRVFRVFRIFKFSRHSTGLRILGQTLQACARELGFLLFTLTMAIVIFSTIIYYLEKSVVNTNFTSIPAAFWYTIVTMTTLGYGDMVPITLMGRLIGSICSLSGVLVIALPVPVIVSNFSRIYTQSQRSEKRREQRRLRQAKVEMRQILMSQQKPKISADLSKMQPTSSMHSIKIHSPQLQPSLSPLPLKPLSPSPNKTVSLASLESLTPSSSSTFSSVNDDFTIHNYHQSIEQNLYYSNPNHNQSQTRQHHSTQQHHHHPNKKCHKSTHTNTTTTTSFIANKHKNRYHPS